MPYPDWIKILAAVRRDIGHDGFDTVKEWSKGGTKYPGDAEFRKYWNAAAGMPQIGIGTLFHLAKQVGYKPLRISLPNQFGEIAFEIDCITEERMATSIYEHCKHLYRVIAGTNIAFVCDPVTNVWVEDKNNAQMISWIIQYKVSGRLMAQQLFSSDSTKAKKIIDTLRKLENYTATRGALATLKSMPDVLVPREAFDANDYLVGMQGDECYDLKTNTVRKIQPEDMISRTFNCHYDPMATAPLWVKSVREWCCGDAELMLLLQKWGGYCLSGLTDFHGYLFLHGDGRNGKSIYINVLKTLMGSYAANMANTTISERKNTSYTGDVHRLQGCRFVCSSEVPDQEYMNEALVKQLTGGDTVTSRENYGSDTEFKPKFKLLLMGNYKPKIKGTDRGIWSRTNLVPFEMKVDDAELDPKLFEKLIAELPGILNWFIEGWRQYQANPIRQSNMPQRVLDANAKYRNEMDVVKCWHDSNTARVVGQPTLGKALYADCVEWLDNNGHRRPNIHDFYGRLNALGYESKKTNKGLVYVDIALAECSISY
jgi:putative DNA primase/helicase